jgi:flagellar biosynthesis/type III secretory pathway protein FliH
MMKRVNPKSHDSLFKWLITSFTKEFFAHYFPEITVGQYHFIDKEFISKYEALKESLKGDLFLLMEIEIDNLFQEVVIQIEHQSERTDVSERLFEYLCYVWLLKKKPVWSIVIYTDEAIWRKSVPDQFCYGFSRKHQQQCFHFDVIKVKAEKSGELIKKHSLLCKLLALKANDEDSDAEQLIYEIYQTAALLKEELSADQLLLIQQWVDFYKKVPEPIVQKIRREVNMELVETTISEHIYNQGKAEGRTEGRAEGRAEGRTEGRAEGRTEGRAEGRTEGRAEGRTEGKAEGLIEGQLALLETLYQRGILSKAQKEAIMFPLQRQIKAS